MDSHHYTWHMIVCWPHQFLAGRNCILSWTMMLLDHGKSVGWTLEHLLYLAQYYGIICRLCLRVLRYNWLLCNLIWMKDIESFESCFFTWHFVATMYTLLVSTAACVLWSTFITSSSRVPLWGCLLLIRSWVFGLVGHLAVCIQQLSPCPKSSFFALF